MKKKSFSLTTSFNWWEKEIHPVPSAVLTASGFKHDKPLKRLMSCFGFSSHWLKPVVNENFRIYCSPRLDALLSSRNKKLSVS